MPDGLPVLKTAGALLHCHISAVCQFLKKRLCFFPDVKWVGENATKSLFLGHLRNIVRAHNMASKMDF
jgi:hypothetical protein